MAAATHFSYDVRPSALRLCALHPGLTADLHQLVASGLSETEVQDARQDILEGLSRLLLEPEATCHVARHCRPILLGLCHRLLAQQRAQGWSLESHEAVSLAFARLLPVAPHVRACALEYFTDVAPFPPFERLNRSAACASEPLENVAFSSHWLAECCPSLSAAWSWAPFFGLLEAQHGPRTRWYALQAIANLTRMSDAQRQRFVGAHVPDEANDCWAADVGYMHDVAIERSYMVEEEAPGPEPLALVDAAALSPDLVDVGGVLLPVSRSKPQAAPGAGEGSAEPGAAGAAQALAFVPIPSAAQNLHSLALALSLGTSVMVEGATGSGKSSLIRRLAELTGNDGPGGLLTIQLSDQMDAKVLVGTYVCTDVPGQFAYQPGALTRAVTEGRWIVFEDVDLAPMEVLSVLLPLVQDRQLFVPALGTVYDAAPGFQMFATQRTDANDGGSSAVKTRILEGLWTRVRVTAPNRAELQAIIAGRYPELAGVAPALLSVYEQLVPIAGDARSHLADASAHGGGGGDGDEAAAALPVAPRKPASLVRPLTARDLLKWAHRLVGQELTHARVFQEAIDCFCSAIASPAARLAVAESIATALDVTRSDLAYLLESYRPEIEVAEALLSVGRVRLQRAAKGAVQLGQLADSRLQQFALSRHSLSLLERVGAAVAQGEHVLLVGETGTGKTTAVQHLADVLRHRLVVVNMSQQSDSADLLGGFKPVDIRSVAEPAMQLFEAVFRQTFSRKANQQFLDRVRQAFAAGRWKQLVTTFENTRNMAEKRLASLAPALRRQWAQFQDATRKLAAQHQQAEKAFAFGYVEGSLARAIQRGDWMLLDELNLASPETLECLNGVLEGPDGSVLLSERGDTEPLRRHPDFRLFACMNPATDVGKRDLPPGIRNRFSEIFVDEIAAADDLQIVVGAYMRAFGTGGEALVSPIVDFYLAARQAADEGRLRGDGQQRPTYSLRTLCRALIHAIALQEVYGLRRSIAEGLGMSFLTQLDQESTEVMERLLRKHVVPESWQADLRMVPRCPGPEYVRFLSYWLRVGGETPCEPQHYIHTPAITSNLQNVARVVASGRFPVLLQGPTSSGKTSLIEYLAATTGHRFVRINNHEHTDIQEYLGSYVSDDSGKLVFQDGALVTAVRHGYWIVLDELNLAPTDVLEALNRLLDDNRELYIPETQETIKAHPQFMVFATQNPAGLYGGRKVLSRAFRNRFVELHFGDIPTPELETIISRRCRVPASLCAKIIAVMKALQQRRQGSRVFSGKHGFITLRDLFRWATRYHLAQQGDNAAEVDHLQVLANDGYMLLAERVRRPDEKATVKEILESVLKRTVDEDAIYDCGASPLFARLQAAQEAAEADPDHPLRPFRNVVWTRAMRRLFRLVERCLAVQEPILLVGETGCGKTTVFQILAALMQLPLSIVNCHQHTEASDFLGGLRPVRAHASTPAAGGGGGGDEVGGDGAGGDGAGGDGAGGDEETGRRGKLFEWVDGPLVEAMRDGGIVLVDEISLADDSVLERLNSVLEPGRTLVLAEKGSEDLEAIVGCDSFRIVSTMNPGGDFGKKELSPALRNRFTEIWVPAVTDHADLLQIVSKGLGEGLARFAEPMLRFAGSMQASSLHTGAVSLRDYRAWSEFTKLAAPTLGPSPAFVHGAHLVFIDAIGVGRAVVGGQPTALRAKATAELEAALSGDDRSAVAAQATLATPEAAYSEDGSRYGMAPFFVNCGPLPVHDVGFTLAAPTTGSNVFRVLRAMQVGKPILLEGSPGVGKTSLVMALAAATGQMVERINLSEHTDVNDLFGSDLPVEGRAGEFAWHDGPLLKVLRSGGWVVLDELNLASQSVLEGLNACLDHRGEVYIPELNKTFSCPAGSFRLFACQNPLHQGGGRKGLPKSFLNRFTQVYVAALELDDLGVIARSSFPSIDAATVRRMVAFNAALGASRQLTACGDVNLRDVFRWGQVMCAQQTPGRWRPEAFCALVYGMRMRTARERRRLTELVAEYFGEAAAAELPAASGWAGEAGPAARPGAPSYAAEAVRITPDTVQVGRATLPRSRAVVACARKEAAASGQLGLLPGLQLRVLEAAMLGVQMGWMVNLVGPPASGKSSVIRLLAELTGAVLSVFSVNASTDTMELLGGFEQIDLRQRFSAIAGGVEGAVHQVTAELLTAGTGPATEEAQGVFNAWSSFQCRGRVNQGAKGDQPPDTEGLRIVATRLRAAMHRFLSEEQRAGVQADPEDALARLEALEAGVAQHTSGAFEWRDGPLVTALREGHWLLVDNVNFCSPSVLDRLNCLLEPGGSLALSERGVIDGAVPVVTPHPSFRLFFAMDPSHGDISRAMRNRGLEISLPTPLGMDSAQRLVSSSTVPWHGVAAALRTVHGEVRASLPPWQGHSVGVRNYLYAAKQLGSVLERGGGYHNALQTAVHEAYPTAPGAGRGGSQVEGGDGGDAGAGGAAEMADRLLRGGLFPGALLSTGCFPKHTDGRMLVTNSRLAAVCGEAAVLINLVLHSCHPALKRQLEAGDGAAAPNPFGAAIDDLGAAAASSSAASSSSAMVTDADDVAAAGEAEGATDATFSPLLAEACLEFAEAASCNDGGLRIALLRHLATRWPVPRAVADGLADACALLEHVCDPAPPPSDLQAATEGLARLLAGAGQRFAGFADQASDFRRNAWLVQVLEDASSGDGGAQDLCRLADRALDMRQLQLRLLRARRVEQRHLAAPASLYALTWAQQSARFAAGELASSRMATPFVRYLQPFFQATHALAEELALRRAPAGGDAEQQDQAVPVDSLGDFVARRDQLWAVCSRAGAAKHEMDSAFGTTWSWTEAALRGLLAAVDVEAGPLAHIANLTDKISRGASQRTGHPLGALRALWWHTDSWRSAQVFQTAKLLADHASALDAAEAVRSWRADRRFVIADSFKDSPAVTAGSKHRRQVAEALATVWALGSTADSMEANVGPELCRELVAMGPPEASARGEEQDSLKLLQALRLLPEQVPAHPTDRRWAHQAVMAAQAWPLREHFSLLAESGLVTRLLDYDFRAAAAAAVGPGSAATAAATDAAFPEAPLTRFLDATLEDGACRAPGDMQVYQQLVWQAEGRRGAGGEGLGAAMQHVLAKFHARQFLNATDLLDPREAVGFKELQKASEEPEETPVAEGGDRGSGPHRKQQAVVLPFTCQLLELQGVGLDSLHAKREQLSAVEALLQSQGGLLFSFSPQREEAEAVALTLCRLLMAVAGAGPDAEAFAACIVRFHAALARDDAAEAAALAEEICGHLAAGVAEATAAEPPHTPDEPLRRHLSEAVAAVARGCCGCCGGCGDGGGGGDGGGDGGAPLPQFGLAWVHIGLVALQLALPSSAIDEASAVSFELGDAAERCRALGLAARCRQALRDLNVGYGNGRRIAELLEQRTGALQRARQLVDEVVHREDHGQYPELFAGLHAFSQSSMDPGRVVALASRLLAAVPGDDLVQALREEGLLQRTQDDFCRHITRQYPSFPDVVLPVASAVYLVKNGLCLLAHAAATAPGEAAAGLVVQGLTALGATPLSSAAGDVFGGLSHLLMQPGAPGTELLAPGGAGGEEPAALKTALLRAVLLRTRNLACQAPWTHDRVLAFLPGVFGAYAAEWERAAAERARIAEEEATMFKHRDRTHAIETMEEKAERELKQLFPTFFDLFQDLEDDAAQVAAETAGQAVDGAAAAAAQEEEDRGRRLLQLDEDVTVELCHTHRVIMEALGPPAGPALADCDRLEVIEAALAAAKACSAAASGALAGLDAPLLSAAVALLHDRRRHAELGATAAAEAKPPRTADKPIGYARAYDFYHDGHPAEALLVRPLLLDVLDRAAELLDEWPEHPVLEQVAAVARRVLNFSVQSPLPKLLTGLDLLLQRLTTWEAQAHREIKVTRHIEELTLLVIRWRKLELATWPDLFAVVLSRFRRQAAQKWFDIYTMIAGATEPEPEPAGEGASPMDEGPEGPEAAGEGPSPGDRGASRRTGGAAQSILQGLEAFMQASTLGEFGARLQLLQSFQRHAKLLAAAEGASAHLPLLVDGLWNLHRFYAQFLPNVEAAVHQGQKPLQKEVRMFVKLQKWKDTNFSSVREAADKTHRKLHKFLKKFAEILEQPIQPTLQGIATGLEFITNDYAMSVMREPLTLRPLTERAACLLPADRAQRSLALLQPALQDDVYLRAGAALDGGAAGPLDGFPLESHPPSKLFLRMRSVLARRVYSTVRCDNITAVDGVCRSVIERVRWLQEWDRQAVEEQHEELARVREEKEKERGKVGAAAKRRKEDKKKTSKATKRKHSKLMKQASLASLFKKLAHMGLSFRRPVHTMQIIDDMLLLPPLAPPAAGAEAEPAGEPTATGSGGALAAGTRQMVDRCDEYYYRILARASAFDSAAVLPAKDVSPNDAERCIGFGRHLLQVVYQQRRFAGSFARELQDLAAIEEALATVVDPSHDAEDLPGDFAPPSQAACAAALQGLHRHFGDVQAMLADCRLLLDADGTLPPERREALLDHLRGCSDRAASGAAQAASVPGGALLSATARAAVRELHSSAEGLLGELGALATALEEVPWLQGARAAISEAASSFGDLLGRLDVGEAGAEAAAAAAAAAEDEDELVQALVAAQRRLAARLLLAVQVLAKRPAGVVDADSGASGAQSAMDERTDAVGEGEDEEEPVPVAPESEDDVGLAANHLFRLHQQLTGDVKRLALPDVNAAAAEVMDAFTAITDRGEGGLLAAPPGEATGALPVATRLLAALHPMLAQFRLLAGRLRYELLAMHRTTCKLEYILLGLFKDLLSKGFCTPPELQEEEGEEDHEGQRLDGVGVGEGAGDKDVSEQIEDEEQVLGTQNEQPEERPQDDGPVEEEQNGLEMSNDFDGELYDRDEPEEGEEERESDGSDAEQPEEQMGQLDSEKAETLDKDMWGGPDKDEEGLDEEANETGGQETGETESAAKQDSSGPDPSGKDDKSGPQQQEEGEAEEEEEDGGDGGPKEPEINQDYEEDAENQPGEGEDEQQQQQGGQPDQDERAPPEELDLPDDLNLDGDMKEKEDAGQPEGGDEEAPRPEDGSGAEMEEEDKEEEFPDAAEPPQEAPHALPDDGAGGEPEGEGEEGGEEPPDAPEGEAEGEGPEEEEEEKGDADQEGRQEPEAMESRPDEGDAESGGPEDAKDEEKGEEEEEEGGEEEEGSGDDRGPEDGSEAMETDGTTAKEDPPEGAEGPAKDEEPRPPQPPPEGDEGGATEARAQLQDAMASVTDDTGAPMSSAPQEETEAATGGAQGDDASASVNAAQQGQQMGQAQRAQAEQRQAYERTHKANPLRDLGDALQTWYDRLNVSDPDEAGPDDGERRTEEQAPQDDMADAYAFAREGEQSDAQTLGAATDEQQADTAGLPDAEEEEEEEGAEEGGEGEEVRAAQRQEQTEAASEVLDTETQSKEGAAEPMDTEEAAPEDGAALGRRQLESQAEEAQAHEEAAAAAAAAGDQPEESEDVARVAEQAAPDQHDPAQPPTEEELAAAREAVAEGWQALHGAEERGEDAEAAALQLWLQMEGVTGHLAQSLCEHLRLILEATKTAKMKGDYRTGKRLNMRKIIPYIASQFRKDKIWLRRTRPSKREYQVMVAVDNSESMAIYRSKQLALEAVCVLTTALSRLEVGELSVVGFGDKVDVIHPFDGSFSATAGGAVLERLHFEGTQSRLGQMLHTAQGLMHDAAQRAGSTNLQSHQLLFVVSDFHNIYQEGQMAVERAARALQHDKVLIVFIIVDNPLKKDSILDHRSISFVGGQVISEDYIDRFADKNYVVLRNIHKLPEQLADVLRQWFEMVAQG